MHRVACLLAAITIGCARAPEPEAPDSFLGTIDPLYRMAVYEFSELPFQPSARELWEALPFDSFRIESSGCYGTCPVFVMELSRGGEARFEGSDHVGALEGSFRGQVDVQGFARLCLFVERFRFDQLEQSYDASATDQDTVTISVVPKGATAVTVSDYGEQAPPEFVAVELALRDLIRTIDWE